MIAVDAGRAAVFVRRTDREGVTGQRNRMAELVTRIGVGGLEVGLLTPGGAAASKDVDRAAVVCIVVSGSWRGRAEAGRVAVFVPRTDREGITGQRNRPAEVVTRIGVGGFEIRLRELSTVDP